MYIAFAFVAKYVIILSHFLCTACAVPKDEVTAGGEIIPSRLSMNLEGSTENARPVYRRNIMEIEYVGHPLLAPSPLQGRGP